MKVKNSKYIEKKGNGIFLLGRGNMPAFTEGNGTNAKPKLSLVSEQGNGTIATGENEVCNQKGGGNAFE